MKLSLLIPSMSSRKDKLWALVTELYNQKKHFDGVEICILIDDKDMNIGRKRNRLLDMAGGKYVAFIDDDDMVSSNYVERLLEGIALGVDCCSLLGVLTWNGKNPELFEHSIRYKEYRTAEPTKGVRYERYPNHLNCIKADIAKRFRFPEIDFGEDTDWATQVFKSGLIKTEHYITDVLYHYQYNRP